ncbi:MAG: ptsI, partial [Anaerospora sp.]|nr:ptsI [Anaerospora sp.]
RECDFFSIGTNDLVQYTLAVDRGNARVSQLYSHYHPSVLRLIDGVIRAAHNSGIWAGVCGEMAGDPGAAVLLAAMGIDELSMSAASIPKVKEQIRRIDMRSAAKLLQQVFELNDAEEIKKAVQKAVDMQATSTQA